MPDNFSPSHALAHAADARGKLKLAVDAPIEITIEFHQEHCIVALAGRLDAATTGKAWRMLVPEVKKKQPSEISLDLSNLKYCDGAGIALILHLANIQSQRQKQFNLVGTPPDIGRLLKIYHEPAGEPTIRHHRGADPLMVETIGQITRSRYTQLRDEFGLLGETLLGLGAALRRPADLRWRDILQIMERVGFDALPILGLLGFLIGLITAFQSAIPLRKFGADIYVANLIGISTLRELGPLLTAVILAGRSGSAFAAEIGTMKVNEEIDALTTMGLSPTRFLVLPRLIAAVAMMPFLTAFMDFASLVGGAVVFINFGFPWVTYVHQIQLFVKYGDALGGLAKSIVFAILVAGIGCVRGLQTGSGATSVGLSATSAVVSGLILIIFADGLFAVLFYALGW